MKTGSDTDRDIMVYVFRVSVLLMALALISCTSEATPTSAPETASPPEAPGNPGEITASPSSTAASDSPTPAATPASTSAPAYIPAPGLPSGPLEGVPGYGTPYTGHSPDYPFPPAPDRNLYQLAAQLSPETGAEEAPPVDNPDPAGYSSGREDTFWLVDFQSMSIYQSSFELRLVSPSAYWYVEKEQRVTQEDLERAAREFEDRIYPQVTASFGHEWSPGVDNDPHLNIIHAGLQGVAGYYSSSDEHPQSIYPYSNERETIYINTRSLSVGNQTYLEVLAHELQHAIHWYGDSSEDTWVNEGLSELAVSVAGYPPSSIGRFLRTPTVSLIHWPLDNADISAHYGGASLFMHYLWEHYSQGSDIRRLVQEPADGIAGIDSYLSEQGYNTNFREVFRDWVVANLLDEEQGKYAYSKLSVGASTGKSIDRFSELESRVPQYAAEYVQLGSLSGPIRIRFEGATENRLLPVEVDEDGCWWSNSGDSISSTLTRAVDLRGQSQATLSYQVWHSVEKNWDYGYVQVSEDQGQTWQVLETPHTTPENPIGNSYGPGYTGDSHDWITESIDLSPYSGREVLLRFHYVTDDAVNGAGLCFRSIAVPEAGLLATDSDWQADGFVLTDNVVTQDYMVQVIQMGEENQVMALTLDADNSGELVIPGTPGLDRVVVAVAALAPNTQEKAPYTLTLEQAD